MAVAPIGVVGPREATPAQADMAERLGRALGKAGAVVLCGGMGGVMEAAARGVAAGGGTTVGLLPGADPAAANPYVDIVLASGLGVARNAVIAQAARCLIAVGGGLGTTTEMAFALQFDKPVYALADAPALPGVTYIDAITPDDAVAEVVDLVGLP